MTDRIEHVGPVEFNERYRYLPSGTTPRPGYIRYDLFPFMKEPLGCFDPMSPVREVNMMKGAQAGYTVFLESVLFYYIGHIKTQACMFLTADGELAQARMDNNIMPSLIESDMDHLIRAAETGNNRKTGKTKKLLQWDGGGSLVFQGAMNAAKMRQHSVSLMLKDELDGWKRAIGNDGNSDALTDARLAGYWESRKILRGSTPLVEPSLINDAYKRGDQRKYMVRCRACGFPQVLKHRKPNTETGIAGGFRWDMDDGVLVLESVRYCCVDCGHPHYEHDKEALFDDTDGNAFWKPTASPAEPGIRSYHLPAFYSPAGFRPWSKCISDFLNAYDPETQQTKSIDKYQEYYNNTLGLPFKVREAKVRFQSVSGHRRACYRLGEIPNEFAVAHAGSKVLFLACLVDVHIRYLAVAVIGFCSGSRPFLIDYWRFDRQDEDDDCTLLDSPVWGRLRGVIEESSYVADDGSVYGVAITLIDAGYANATVVKFCEEYTAGVYPILGRDRPAKNQTIKEFAEFKTTSGTIGFRITVDHYKDRMAPVLRREWVPEMGDQPEYHFNAPVDVTDKQLKELTVESRKEKIDDKGESTYYWHRPGNAPNELWDLLGYGYAAVEIFAWTICIQRLQLETIDWPDFWKFAESSDSDGIFCRGL